MATTQQTPQAQRPQLSLRDVTGKGSGLPNRYALHAVEGWGKTSLAAMFPKPLVLQTRGETGLETLIDAGRLPETPHLPEIMTWRDLRNSVQMIGRESHSYKTLAVDTINGAERLCWEHVCTAGYGGDWEKFGAYGRGPEMAMSEWRGFLQDLEIVRQQRQMIIFLLIHTKVTKFKNPEGADFDRYQPELNANTWSLTHKWLDVILFGNFLTVTTEDKTTKRAKGEGGEARTLYATRTAAWDAKNRIGLPSEIMLGNSAQEAYAALIAAVKAGRLIAAPETTTVTGAQQ